MNYWLVRDGGCETSWGNSKHEICVRLLNTIDFNEYGACVMHFYVRNMIFGANFDRWIAYATPTEFNVDAQRLPTDIQLWKGS